MNGIMYQGMSLNIYMLLLASLQVPNSATWRQEICMDFLIVRLRFALDSEAAKKNSILTYLQQIWHLVALMMVDDCA